MISSNKLEKLILAIEQEPENLNEVAVLAQEFPDKFNNYNVQLLVNLAFEFMQTAEIYVEVFAVLQKLINSDRVIQIPDVEEFNLENQEVTELLSMLAPAIDIQLSANELMLCATKELYELIECSALTALPDIDSFILELPLLHELRNFNKFTELSNQELVFEEVFELKVLNDEILEALADSFSYEESLAFVEELKPEVIIQILNQSNYSTFALGVALNYMEVERSYNEEFLVLLRDKFAFECDDKRMEIFIKIFALCNSQEELLLIFEQLIKEERPNNELYCIIIASIRELPLERMKVFVDLSLKLSELEIISRELLAEIINALMDILAEPNTLLKPAFDGIMFAFDRFSDELKDEEHINEDDSLLINNMNSWYEYVETWMK